MRISILHILILQLLFSHLAIASSSDLLNKLNNEIEKQQTYYNTKETSINKLRVQLSHTKKTDINAQFEIVKKLVQQYELYKYDSAYLYANKLLILSYQTKEESKIAYAKFKMGFVLGAKGLFKEATDTLDAINSNHLPPSEKIEYYQCMVKTYFDLEHFSNDKYYSPHYKNIAIQYCDSIMLCTPQNSHLSLIHNGLKKMVTGKINQSIPLYTQVLNNEQITLHQKAMYNATLGFLYKINGDLNQAIKYLTIASIADLKANVKETTALRGLAELLYIQGDLDNAYKYILVAKTDADFYGTKHRILEISNILPHIEGAYLSKIDDKRKQMLKSVVLVATLSLLALVFLVITLLQISKLRKARKAIWESNESLQLLNDNLREANIVKEQYIGYYFNISSQFIEKLEKLKKTIGRQLSTNQIDNIKLSLSEINPKKERAQLFEDFDKIFLSIFPEFVNKYNALFLPEDVIIEKGNLLTTPQRIFALLKIGVTDNEKIAKILNFSVNTIYTYKTKAKNKSTVSNDNFESIIMGVKSI